ncbi:MAG: CPBP family intramembrane metalloprotease [Deltaproteobacteria bacterium]|nr:CPBP family intramembrane metalloprotease [Deltaproteobacteria bacterium]MBI4224527.1 CPBP family intramembrane metalloprotease [Deltaproteobacteria bacterium]
MKAPPTIDRQTAVVLIAAALLGMSKFTFGSVHFFDQELSGFFNAGRGSLWSYIYFFGMQGLTGFGIPLFILLFLFRRSPREAGLGLGDFKLGLTAVVLYLPVATLGCWFLSSLSSFQETYPFFRGVLHDWRLFAAYEVLFLFYWIGWEYLWRGFLLFGTARTFGVWSIFIQTLPFAALHAQRPWPEAYLSVLGALLLGALVWRCRSFWVAVPIHAWQMVAIDFFCTLRLKGLSI